MTDINVFEAMHECRAIRWGVAGRIVWAWVFTIPASAFISAVTWSIVHAVMR